MNELTSLNPRGSSASSADPKEELSIAGVTAFTTIDFPGRLSAVLYTQGCMWRCRYCHNSHLWPFEAPRLHWQDIHAFLTQRVGLLDAVVFSGGEPTAHAPLGAAMQDVKRWGFEVGLHTAGVFPQRLEEVLRLCDWVGMDIKAPFGQYEKITGIQNGGEVARRSAELVLESGVAHEFRTTFHSDLLSESDILALAKELKDMGATRYALQIFRKTGCPDASLRTHPVGPSAISPETRARLVQMFHSFTLRDS